MEQPTNPYASPKQHHPPIEPASPTESPLGSLAGVVLGLRLVSFGLVGMIVADIILAAHPFWMNAISSKAILMRLRMLLFLGELLALAGVGVCLLTPREVRAERPLRIAAGAAMAIIAIEILRDGSFFIYWLNIRALWSPTAEFATFVLTSTTQIAFLLYLKRLAWFVHRRNLIVASQRMIGFTIAIIGFQFWQSGYFDWVGHAWPGRAAISATEQIVEILWPAFFALAAVLIHRLRKAVSSKQVRYLRLVQRG
jgi:hypothetical protein